MEDVLFLLVLALAAVVLALAAGVARLRREVNALSRMIGDAVAERPHDPADDWKTGKPYEDDES